jgi:hypothetical protein
MRFFFVPQRLYLILSLPKDAQLSCEPIFPAKRWAPRLDESHRTAAPNMRADRMPRYSARLISASGRLQQAL